ncbi:hypothetical protein QTP70_023338 [Hemibagrus guttatus]|uniref:Tetraspanin-33 n=1 Tax=Hemibagrus guttatus TaxID=175788 RepID=A0AAE0QUD8_9TELE|nr:hypothetical protein QTP70_023338 [Hemibagrus guttatus]KAK3562311.1 hypothetical protein QTP86_033322 [Hemibagrus guttatus]
MYEHELNINKLQFIGILSVILFLQIIAAILGFLFSDMVLGRTELLMNKAIVLYREDMDLENAIDFVQKKFLCCGVSYYSDWSQNEYFNCSVNNPSLEACGVPFSCCVRQQNETVFNSMCGYKTQGMEESFIKKRIYINGCLKKIVQWGKQNLLLVGGISIGLLCLEVRCAFKHFFNLTCFSGNSSKCLTYTYIMNVLKDYYTMP